MTATSSFAPINYQTLIMLFNPRTLPSNYIVCVCVLVRVMQGDDVKIHVFCVDSLVNATIL